MKEDNEIIDLYWHRDETAIQETDAKYHRYCFYIAKHITNDKEDSEECISDTWLSAWNAIPPERPDQLQTWLGCVCRNLAINLYEKNHAQKRNNGETDAAADELAEILSNGTDSEQELIAKELSEEINRFLNRLDSQTRIFFVQRYWYLLSIKEIAAQNHASQSKVKMTLLRTREKLRSYLQEEGYQA